MGGAQRHCGGELALLEAIEQAECAAAIEGELEIVRAQGARAVERRQRLLGTLQARQQRPKILARKGLALIECECAPISGLRLGKLVLAIEYEGKQRAG